MRSQGAASRQEREGVSSCVVQQHGSWPHLGNTTCSQQSLAPEGISIKHTSVLPGIAIARCVMLWRLKQCHGRGSWHTCIFLPFCCFLCWVRPENRHRHAVGHTILPRHCEAQVRILQTPTAHSKQASIREHAREHRACHFAHRCASCSRHCHTPSSPCPLPWAPQLTNAELLSCATLVVAMIPSLRQFSL